MRIFVVGALILLMSMLSFFLLRPEFRSAFEADQQCHFEKSVAIASNSAIDCDHDIETKQWLLFQIGDNDQPSKVLKRYRY